MSGYPYQPVHSAEGHPQNAPPPYATPGQYPPGYPPAQPYPPTQPYPAAPTYPPPPGYDAEQPNVHQSAPYPEVVPQGGPYQETSYADPGITMFSEKSVRRAFIRKVYSILFAQLLVSIGIVCLFVFHEGLNSYAKRNMAMFYTAWVATIVIIIAIACCEKPRRVFPLNFGLLALFTLCESYLLGVVSAHYEAKEVLMAMGIVAVLSLAITIFALQTRIDFTMLSGFLFVAVIVLVCFGILVAFFHSTVLRLVYACLGALIFGIYLVFDTQLMMGGRKKYALSPEEYIFAALNLYIDIATMFMYILQIVGIAK